MTLVPTTIVGGYLGSGKTTLINHVLRSHAWRNVGLIVNDLSSLNIDAELVAEHDGETLSLQNGCICCSISDSLGATLDMLLARRPEPERILIETSGVANPRKVAYYGQGWPGLALDCTIVMIDAETIIERARDKFVGDLIMEQIFSADILVLNKADRLSASEQQSVRDWLLQKRDDARIVTTSFGRLDQGILFEQRHAVPARETAAASGSEAPDFISFAITESLPFDRTRLAHCLDGMPREILRAKGFLYMAEDEDHEQILQQVGPRWTLEQGAPWGSREKKTRIALVALPSAFDVERLARDHLRKAISAVDREGAQPADRFGRRG